MFYCQAENKYINEGTAFTVNGVQYGPGWLNQASAEEKLAIGLQEVIFTNNPADERFYWVQMNLNGAVGSYANTPKDLAGLKSAWEMQVRGIAYSILLPTDWMVVKAMETQTPVPEAWNTWRQAVRQTTNDTITAMDAAQDVPAFVAVVTAINWPQQPTE